MLSLPHRYPTSKTLVIYKAYGKIWMASCCNPSYCRHFLVIMPFVNSKIIRFMILLPSDKTLLDYISSPLMHGCRCMYSNAYHIIIIIIIIIIITTTTTTTTLVRTCPKISRNRPGRQCNHTGESTSSN
jgi:hypothetical protein